MDIKTQNHGASLSIALEIAKYKMTGSVTASSVVEDAREIYKYLKEVSNEAAS